MSDVILGANQYGKAENHVVRVTRDSERHDVIDLEVTSLLRGDFAAAHTRGDNAHVVPTDTQKNTVFALARDGIADPESFLLRLSDHFTSEFAWVDGGVWSAQEHGWSRIAGHDHCFYRSAPEVRTAAVVRDGERTAVLAGFHGLTVMKTTQSGFAGFPRDGYTTLPETEDRILATEISTRWRYGAGTAGAAAGGLDFDAVYDDVKRLILEAFTDHYSRALQETIYLMGERVLAGHPEVEEIRFSCPNKHHFLSDLAFCGLDNPGLVFYAADRPYGLIEASVRRAGAEPADAVWAGVSGFC